jgi:hypothetical protein
MKSYADSVSGGKFDRNALAAYRSKRYDESVAVSHTQPPQHHHKDSWS